MPVPESQKWCDDVSIVLTQCRQWTDRQTENNWYKTISRSACIHADARYTSLAVLTYKVRSTSTPVYLHDQITERACRRTSRYPAAGPTVHQDRLFQASFQIFSIVSLEFAATNSNLINDSLSVFKSKLKTFRSLRLH